MIWNLINKTIKNCRSLVSFKKKKKKKKKTLKNLFLPNMSLMSPPISTLYYKLSLTL